jgi:hypothetical protein
MAFSRLLRLIVNAFLLRGAAPSRRHEICFGFHLDHILKPKHGQGFEQSSLVPPESSGTWLKSRV